jgi:hypothetical protein
VFFGPPVFGCSIVSNHPKKDLISIGDTFVENYPSIRKLMKCWLTIKTVLECGEIFSNLLFSKSQSFMDITRWEGSYAYSSIGCTLHLQFTLVLITYGVSL